MSETSRSGLTPRKLLVVLGMMAVAFVGAYNFASAQSTASAAGATGASDGGFFAQAASSGGCGMSGGAGGAGGAGGGCCGGGGAPVEGATTAEGAVQKIAVDTSQGSFSPNVIKAKAGVPIEIAFSQAPGGCLSGVFFPDFNINEDLTAGPKTVTLPALDPGEYSFFCQMQMVSAKIVVE
ncbi:MAG: cupredoxin domain-containing protein [Coriobacteriia bacterium]